MLHVSLAGSSDYLTILPRCNFGRFNEHERGNFLVVTTPDVYIREE